MVLVKSIDDAGTIGSLIEAFRVVKEHGKNPKKGYPLPVTSVKPAVLSSTTQAACPQPVGKTIIEEKGKALEVKLYASMDVIRTARKAGLNGGTLVAVQTDKGKTLEVYAVHKGRIDTLGKYQPLI